MTSTRAAAYEVDYFEAVAVIEQRFRPAISRNDFAVEFDSDAVGLHGQGFDQGYERELRRNVREGAGFSVDVKIHFDLLGFAEGEFAGYGAAFVVGLDHYGGV
jgi:hypothetical protein